MNFFGTFTKHRQVVSASLFVIWLAALVGYAFHGVEELHSYCEAHQQFEHQSHHTDIASSQSRLQHPEDSNFDIHHACEFNLERREIALLNAQPEYVKQNIVSEKSPISDVGSYIYRLQLRQSPKNSPPLA